MKSIELDNLLASLPDLARPEGTPFSYHRNEYALLLLGWMLDEPRRVAELKRTRFGRLLKNAATRQAVARAPNGWLSAEDLLGSQPRGHRYVVSLGRWGTQDCDPEDYQLTRRGENLVIQLNFPDWHDSEYRRLVDPGGGQPFVLGDHPVSQLRNTVAWARVDVDLHHRHALIEEVQSDWMRYALDAYQDAASSEEATIEYDEVRIRRPAMIEYYEAVLVPHARVWAEATLCAALWVLRERLGIEAVWFHTFEGSRLKGDCDPPRGLYTDLPRKFCFGKTREAPAFLHWKDSPVLKHSLGPGAKNPVDWFHLPLN